MIIHFDKDRKLEDIQIDFVTQFPYLKLVFAPVTKGSRQGSTTIYSDATVGDLNTIVQPGNIDVTGNMTVMELEKTFAEKIGASVKVLRKAGNIWLETSITSNWTLARQNEHAHEISNSRVF
ncbi:MAG TPA: hypothetical protein VHB48_02540 [Chitinophagaceae bacterium]|nr:hypothetical protein [Chitinophagaceae bacterium]